MTQRFVDLLIRKVKKLKKWQPHLDQPPQTPDDDVSADPVTDLSADNDAVSFYAWDGEIEKLKLIAGALAASDVVRAEFLVIQQNAIEHVPAALFEEPGNTKCDEANKLHRDVAALSGNKLVRLTNRLIAGQRLEMVQPMELAQWLDSASKSGRITMDKNLTDKVAKILRNQSSANKSQLA